MPPGPRARLLHQPGCQQAPDEQTRDQEADQSRETQGCVRRRSKIHDKVCGRLEQRELDRKEEWRSKHRHLGSQKVDSFFMEEQRRVSGRRLAECLGLGQGLVEGRNVHRQCQRHQHEPDGDG
jgi:hypothetical protein